MAGKKKEASETYPVVKRLVGNDGKQVSIELVDSTALLGKQIEILEDKGDGVFVRAFLAKRIYPAIVYEFEEPR